MTQSADTGEQSLARDRLGAGPRGNEGKVGLPERLTQPIGEIEQPSSPVTSPIWLAGMRAITSLARRGSSSVVTSARKATGSLLAQHADIVGGQLLEVLKRRGVAPEQARELQDLRARV